MVASSKKRASLQTQNSSERALRRAVNPGRFCRPREGGAERAHFVVTKCLQTGDVHAGVVILGGVVGARDQGAVGVRGAAGGVGERLLGGLGAGHVPEHLEGHVHLQRHAQGQIVSHSVAEGRTSCVVTGDKATLLALTTIMRINPGLVHGNETVNAGEMHSTIPRAERGKDSIRELSLATS
eukprot:CAMPEP_0180252338 /NCGR_PEP_ID=MMETSP0987-20121128/38944_1 /TAXON_ID=697907 /ORGANISM="non described non described, Strain CCMP2293" /LENGTH=181 /DNA_ID=CAMNT_0022220993 /DNA_START=67 /DNA_END=612 /DNA_ORIENTATION=+